MKAFRRQAFRKTNRRIAVFGSHTVSYQVKYIDSAILFLIYPTEMKTKACQRTCTKMFIAASSQ
jgi:hypothetical protein